MATLFELFKGKVVIMKFSFVFPGQGSQHLGMLGNLSLSYPHIRETFDEASDCLGYDLWMLTQEDPELKLNLTEYTQPALLASSVALWRTWVHLTDARPIYLAGHSLGEYSALVCAQALEFKDAVGLVAARGRFMQASVQEGDGGIAAIIGLKPEVIQRICNQISRETEKVAPANFNSLEQTVIAGHLGAVDQAIDLAKELGAKRAVKLPMSVPSHTVLMRSAADQLKEKIEAIPIKVPKIPVCNNVDVACYDDPEQIADALVRQLYNPVRWMEIVQFLSTQKIQLILECGPGKVLSGLNKRIASDIESLSLSQLKAFDDALNVLGGVACS